MKILSILVCMAFVLLVSTFGQTPSPTATPIEKIIKETPTPVDKMIKETPTPIQKIDKFASPTPSALADAAKQMAEQQRLLSAYQSAMNNQMKTEANRAMGRATAKDVQDARARTAAAKAALDEAHQPQPTP